MLGDETSIKQRSQTYFHKLLNKERNNDIVLGALAHFERLQDFGYCECFSVGEVKRTISRLSKRRATGTDEISMEFWRSTSKANMEWLTKVLYVVFKTAKMHDTRRWRKMLLLYKNMGDIQNCKN